MRSIDVLDVPLFFRIERGYDKTDLWWLKLLMLFYLPTSSSGASYVVKLRTEFLFGIACYMNLDVRIFD